MRIWIRSIVLGLAFLLIVLALPNIAEASTATFQVNQKTYTVDDHNYSMDAAPYIRNGRLYVPIRYVALVCGLKAENIKYDKTTRVLTLVNDNGIETMLMVGAKRILINGVVSDTDAAPQMVKGRLYVPVRQIALAFQHKLYWDDKKKLLTIDIGNYLPEALDDIEKKNYAAAVDKCSKFLTIDPMSSKAYLVQGLGLFKLSQFAESVNSFNKVIELDPKNEWGYISRAEARWNIYYLAEKAEAGSGGGQETTMVILNDVSQALEMSSDKGTLYCRRAGLYNYLSDYDQAIADATKAIELKPDYPVSYYRLATAYYFKFGKEKYETELNTILEKFPKDQWATNCMDLLKKGKKFTFDLTDW